MQVLHFDVRVFINYKLSPHSINPISDMVRNGDRVNNNFY